MTSPARNTDADGLDFVSASATAEPVAEQAEAVSRRVLMFDLAGHRHCAGIDEVREIVPAQATTRLPGAESWVRGLINLRGHLVTVLDASLCVYGNPVDSPLASILLVEVGSRVAGVMVDDVHDIGLLDKDVSQDALVDLGAMVRTALA
jgi:chemotaxis signal transduction protein